MSLNLKYSRAIFPPKFKSLIYELICVKNNFIQQPSKMTMDPLQGGFFCATRTEATTQTILKVQRSLIED